MDSKFYQLEAKMDSRFDQMNASILLLLANDKKQK
jgi:hypothetical protein